MDRKSVIILVVSFIVIFSWSILTPKIWPPKPIPGYKTNSLALATNQVANGTNTPPVLTANTNLPAVPVLPIANTNSPEQTLVAGNDLVRYTFTSRGGGIKQLELLHYPETVDCHSKLAETNLATLNASAPWPILDITGSDILQGDGAYQLEKTASGVVARRQMPGGLLIEKEFQLRSNYLVAATLRLRNTGAQPLALPAQHISVGTATPMGPLDNEQAVSVQWYDGSSDQKVDQGWFANRFLGCFSGTPREVYSMGANNVHWATAQNQFFAIALMPAEPAAQVIVRKIDLPPPSKEVLALN
ncbi:MAG TPA: membrane protein insertase YidC, partial [Candidatus Saccharimonadales bacterium]|nr:membrane protein insertase YidC [Candidatus Saccharimonadales bacterium]